MQDFGIFDWLVIAAICLTAASLAVFVLSPRLNKFGSTIYSGVNVNDPVFLFDETLLIDKSSSAARLLCSCSDPTSWSGIRKMLLPTFPGLPETPDMLRTSGAMTLGGVGNNHGREAVCEWIDGVTRVHLRKAELPENPICGSELQNLRTAMDAAPYPVWRESEEGRIAWCNQAYENLHHRLKRTGRKVSDPLFPELSLPVVAGRKSRVSIPVPDSNQKLWFDVSTVPNDGGKLGYAVDINAVVDAEIAQRNFVQTLAKTFAQLSIGLAIFDRNRQLALFNPALIDLTALQADFLSSRPTLFDFFDRLRDSRVMPEPKDIKSWRQRISDLVEAAADGRYQETWSLPSGSVYSVSGRPHPDGAVAFLFEDITAEITLTRRFRSELELGQSIVDNLDQAIAVFSGDGTLTFSNATYHAMWGLDPDTSFAQMTVLESCRAWQDKCRPTMLWGRVSDIVQMREHRSESWEDVVEMRSGQRFTCKVSPIQNGATMICFSKMDGSEISEQDTVQLPVLT
ncbi:PAS-domain containing protein [Aliisedimentitalea scapharcae]|uniref:PAS-domain containing protein n=1 Tax=Aliisedimentitalea scapharcae TaxID=1524259 RepID=A0ABZ2XV50_9RHOB